MHLDPLRLAVAVGPVALYLLVIGVLHMGRRPIVVLGTRDAAVLGVALSGFVFVGPIDLFLPAASAIHYKSIVWLFMGGLYLSTLSLIILGMRPRLIVYNIRLERLRPALEEVVRQLDANASWAGPSAALPSLGVTFYLEDAGAMRNVTIASAGREQSPAGWRRLETALQRRMRSLEVRPRNAWFQFSLAGAALLAMAVFTLWKHPEAIQVTLNQFFSP